MIKKTKIARQSCPRVSDRTSQDDLLTKRAERLGMYAIWGFLVPHRSNGATGYQLLKRRTRELVIGPKFEVTFKQAMTYLDAFEKEQTISKPRALAMAVARGFELKPVRSGGFRVWDKATGMNIYGSTRYGCWPSEVIGYLSNYWSDEGDFVDPRTAITLTPSLVSKSKVSYLKLVHSV